MTKSLAQIVVLICCKHIKQFDVLHSAASTQQKTMILLIGLAQKETDSFFEKSPLITNTEIQREREPCRVNH